MNKKLFKSIWAVVAGFLIVAVLSTLTDTILETVGIFPSIGTGLFVPWMLMLALIYRCIFTVLGGYVVARLSPQNKEKHVKILGVLGTIGGILGIFAGWNLSPHWYPIALAVTAFPCIWLGGQMYLQSKKGK